jgi:transcriptional regulator GlxA family with amidase domain
LPSGLVHRLLAGQVVLDPPRDRPATYLDLIKNWIQLIEQGSAEAHRIVLLEAEARLRRLALDLATRDSGKRPRPTPPAGFRGSIGRFEQMATLVVKHFHEPLSVEDIAEAVRMKPPAAMRLFRKFSGMTLHEYVLRLRVSHAQRLLATTDAKILAVAEQSGFGSPARFYACFRRLVGQSPAAYRRSFQRGN